MLDIYMVLCKYVKMQCVIEGCNMGHLDLKGLMTRNARHANQVVYVLSKLFFK